MADVILKKTPSSTNTYFLAPLSHIRMKQNKRLLEESLSYQLVLRVWATGLEPAT